MASNLQKDVFLSMAQTTGPSLGHSFSSWKKLLFGCALTLVFSSLAYGQSDASTSKIEITEPQVPAGATLLSQGPIELTFKITGPITKKVRVKVDADVDGATQDITFDKSGDHTVQINLFKGKNTISLLGFNTDHDKKPSSDLRAVIKVTCNGRHCDAEGPLVSEVKDDPSTGGPTPPVGGGAGGGPGKTDKAKAVIEITSPKADNVFQNAVIPLELTVNKRDDSKQTPANPVKQIEKISILVLNADGNLIPQEQNTVKVEFKDSSKSAVLPPTNIRIGPGKNSIVVFDAAQPIDTADRASVAVQRLDVRGSIHITSPGPGAHYQDATIIPISITVDKKPKDPQVQTVFIRVLNQGKPIADDNTSLGVTFAQNEATAKLTPKIKIGKGKNLITVFDADKPIDVAEQDSVVINCDGDDCGSGNLVSTIDTSSQHTRLVVGFEQAGASSARSKTSPFLDLYFTAPLRFIPKNDILSRVSGWGEVRLSTTPEQIGAVGAFPSNLVNQLTQTGNIVDLVQSFDFLAGGEIRAFDSNSAFASLIPGVKQKSHIYFAAGGGAISPLSTTNQSAQIYRVPKDGDDNLQRKLFINRFGAKAANKADYIAFVFPERDRFLRQWYAGFRMKTFYCGNPECTEIVNHFPAIFDVMIGQNEAVTGGKLKNDVTDESGMIIGRKRSYVLRLDGFYPLPIKQANFLYLYGTALLKIGGGGVKITNPLFLDTAPGNIMVTSPKVFIAPTLQLDRDYYKFGVGVNLTDLFNHKTTTPK